MAMAACPLHSLGSQWVSRHAAGVKFGLSSSSSCMRVGRPARGLIVVGATGFGKRPQTKPKPRIPKEFDLKTVERTETYRIFVREEAAEEEAGTKWEELGDVLVEAGANIEIAIKERRSALAAAVNEQHPAFQGKVVQFGICEDRDSGAIDEDYQEEEEEEGEEVCVKNSEEESIVALDLSGKLPEETVRAILRLRRVEEHYKTLEKPRALRPPAFLPLTRRQRSH